MKTALALLFTLCLVTSASRASIDLSPELVETNGPARPSLVVQPPRSAETVVVPHPASAVTPPPLSTSPTNPPNLQLVVSLIDGSRVVGGTDLKNLPLRSDALGKVEIPFAKIRSIKFSADHTSAIVVLGNGDKVQGAVSVVSLTMQTVFGVVPVPVAIITGIEFRTEGGGKVEADDILLHFTFAEDTGGKVIDQSANHLDGIVHDATWVSNGHHGGALEFNGRNSRVEVPQVAKLNFGHGDFSVSFWFRVNHLGEVQQLYWHQFNPEIQVEPDGMLRAYYAYRFCGKVDSTAQVTPNEWHFITMTRKDGTGYIYLDGEETAHVDASACDSSSDGPWLLGFDGKMGEPLDGMLADFTIWKRALRADEVHQLYQQDR